MKDASTAAGLNGKIARLVQERGWNQEEFARIAGLNRLTVRGILQTASRRLHNATLAKCARALDLTVYDLCELPLEKLLSQSRATLASPGAPGHAQSDDSTGNGPSRRRYEEATQPELLAWMHDNAVRAGKLSADEWDELLSLQGTGGPLTVQGVERFVDQIERKRLLLEKMAAIAGTEYIDLLEQFVEVLYEKIQPYRDRK